MNIDWHAFLPETLLAGALLVLLLVDLILPSKEKWQLPGIAALGLVIATIPVLTLAADGDTPRVMFAGSYVVDDFALVLKGLFLAAGYVVLFLSFNTIEEGAYYRGEYYFLILCSILGMMLIAGAISKLHEDRC